MGEAVEVFSAKERQGCRAGVNNARRLASCDQHHAAFAEWRERSVSERGFKTRARYLRCTVGRNTRLVRHSAKSLSLTFRLNRSVPKDGRRFKHLLNGLLNRSSLGIHAKQARAPIWLRSS